jgi:hypothetical protein
MTKELILSGTINQIEQQLEVWGLTYEEGKQYYSKLPDIEAVIYLGRRIAQKGEYDEEGNEITAPVYADGYHFDVMCEQEISFDNAIEPNNPKHQFAGYE